MGRYQFRAQILRIAFNSTIFNTEPEGLVRVYESIHRE